MKTCQTEYKFYKPKFEEPVRHSDQYVSNFCQTRANFIGFAGMSDTFRHLCNRGIILLFDQYILVKYGYLRRVLLGRNYVPCGLKKSDVDEMFKIKKARLHNLYGTCNWNSSEDIFENMYLPNEKKWRSDSVL